MKQKLFTGTGVALVTPFLANGEVDHPALRQITEHVIKNGVDYLVAMGTTAESVTLNCDEKDRVLETILSTNNSRKPVVLGMGGNNTSAVAQAIMKQSFDGISGLLSVAPYYNKPNQQGLFLHFESIAAASPVPVIIYNVPGRTGSNISADTTVRLAHENSNIVATKEASGNFEQIMNIVANKPDDFLVISGDDALTLPLISVGVEGLISVTANALPGRVSDMVRYALTSNCEKAKALHYELLELITLLFAEGSPAGVKSALYSLGLCDPFVRLPLVPVSKGLGLKINNLIKRLSE